MGTSHHEPMMRSQGEWYRHKQEYGNGEWNYKTNAEGLRKFWTDGVIRNKNYENIYTMGMRGDGDMAMPDAGGLQANMALLEKIITDQREILAAQVNPDVTKVPQLWALYTEVQRYYDAGLKAPDDVTPLFSDDNVGNLSPPSNAARTRPLRRYRNLLPHGHERRSVLLQVAQQQSAAKNLGTDEPRCNTGQPGYGSSTSAT